MSVTIRATRMCRVPVRVWAVPGGIAVTVHTSDRWTRAPTAALRLRGSAQSQGVPLSMADSPGSFAGHVCGLPASVEGTIEVTAATSADVQASAIEDFSFVRTEKAIGVVGPGGHLRLEVKPSLMSRRR